MASQRTAAATTKLMRSVNTKKGGKYVIPSDLRGDIYDRLNDLIAAYDAEVRAAVAECPREHVASDNERSWLSSRNH